MSTEEVFINLGLLAFLTVLGLPYTDTKSCRSGKVFKLEPHDFNSTISQGTFFIKFYKPGCPSCVLLAPIWNQLAMEMNNHEMNLCVTEYNCESNISVCRDLNIRSVPQILWFENGRNVRQYNGGRNMTAMKRFAQKMFSYNGVYKSGTLSEFADSKRVCLSATVIIINLFIYGMWIQ